MAKRKFAELQVSLSQLQESLDIPVVTLSIHPAILNAVATCPNQPIEAIGELVNDSTFLNAIQSNVNSWIKEVQKLSTLDRDIKEGSSSQELGFWINLEKALIQTQEKLASSEVQLTLSILRSAKRFHATTSFLADTGIKEAIDLVSRYNQLIRDFPMNDILSCVQVDKLEDGIVSVFGHFNKKLRLSSYPILRSAALVEVISRDLLGQLKVNLNGKSFLILSSRT